MTFIKCKGLNKGRVITNIILQARNLLPSLAQVLHRNTVAGSIGGVGGGGRVGNARALGFLKMMPKKNDFP